MASTLPLKVWKASPKTSRRLDTILILYFIFSTALFLYSVFFVISNNKILRNDINFPHVSETKRTDLSQILFGIGSSAETWHDRRHYSELWWKPNVTHGFVWLEKKPPLSENAKWAVTWPPYKVSGDTHSTSSSESRSAVRLARIVKESFELGLENVRWFVIGEDDTVFFLENLVTVLNKYDHKQMYYIGGNSESVKRNVLQSYGMAFGGGGFAVSHALAAELVRVFDGCVNRSASFDSPDLKIHSCMVELGVPLTKEPGFHQMDIKGNPYGLLAAHPQAPLVSLHRLDKLKSIYPGMTKMDSMKKLFHVYETDPARILQQTFSYDLTRNWTISVSWGYTVQLYQSILTPKQLEKAMLTFQPWSTEIVGDQFTFNTRTIGYDPCERPVVYFFEAVERFRAVKTHSIYRKQQGYLINEKECDKVDHTEHALAIEAFTISASTLDPSTWRMAPRRQCCSVVKQENIGGEGIILQVEIRGCHPFETTTPPMNEATNFVQKGFRFHIPTFQAGLEKSRVENF